jgi:hypothetical protein
MKKAKKTILSIDWDYFVPACNSLDLGFNENFSEETKKNIWYVRKQYSPEITKKLNIINEYQPYSFLNNLIIHKNISFSPDCKVVVCDSHRFAYLEFIKKEIKEIINIDNHHDLGYRINIDKDKEISCENWLSHLYNHKRGFEITQIFPEHRKKNKENFSILQTKNKITDNLKIRYGLKNFPTKKIIDQIFICRSGNFTPPWSDNGFAKFVNQFNKFDLEIKYDLLPGKLIREQ